MDIYQILPALFALSVLSMPVAFIIGWVLKGLSLP